MLMCRRVSKNVLRSAEQIEREREFVRSCIKCDLKGGYLKNATLTFQDVTVNS